jgi:hypothetical protein
VCADGRARGVIWPAMAANTSPEPSDPPPDYRARLEAVHGPPTPARGRKRTGSGLWLHVRPSELVGIVRARINGTDPP